MAKDRILRTRAEAKKHDINADNPEDELRHLFVSVLVLSMVDSCTFPVTVTSSFWH